VRKKIAFVVISFLVLIAAVAIVSIQNPRVQAAQPQLVSVPEVQAPTLDGVANEAFWANAPAIDIPVAGGANTEATTVTLKSVYTPDMVYFVAQWKDPTESFLRAPWEMQPDGTWKQLKDPKDKGGDNNVWYEDKLAFIWPISNSIPGFETAGCFTVCHAGDTPEVKPYGNKYTAEKGQMGDIWHWKSVRDLKQVHDQYLDATRWSKETPDAGRHGDPTKSGGYVDNKTKDGKLPAFMPAGANFPKDGSPGSILDSEKVPFDAKVFKAGDRLSGIVKSEFVGDSGDIPAGWKWADGVWTLEFGRKLVTGSPNDVQFDKLGATYPFAVATFDNAQVRHAFQTGATQFAFQQK
jgi:hypothetical protein